MSTERDKEALDQLVSGSYRDLPTPRTPERLNETILRMATSETQSKGSSLFTPWMKPASLAATIALSLFVVMEISDIPTTPSRVEAVREVEDAAANEVLLEEVLIDDSGLLKREAKGRLDSFAASSPAMARPAARKPGAEPLASIEQRAEKLDSDAATACDEHTKQSATDWLECIDQLRRSGATQDAEREYEAFMLEYPTGQNDSELNK